MDLLKILRGNGIEKFMCNKITTNFQYSKSTDQLNTKNIFFNHIRIGAILVLILLTLILLVNNEQ